MQKLTRWQAMLALAAGAYAALSPLWTRTNDTATWTMATLGVVTAAIAVWSLATSEDRISEYALVVMGILFIASPWAMNFERLDNLALTAWVVGAITLIAGFLAVPQVESRMHFHHGPIAH